MRSRLYRENETKFVSKYHRQVHYLKKTSAGENLGKIYLFIYKKVPPEPNKTITTHISVQRMRVNHVRPQLLFL